MANPYLAAAIADWVGVAGLAIAAGGLLLVWRQVQEATRVARAQATIQFQAAFHKSRDERIRLQREFPVHEDVLSELATPGTEEDFRTWRFLHELTKEQIRDAEAVINAMNDVAQYVVDGLPLQSALQQYHTIFVRTGVLLLPYLDQRNAPKEGKPQARYGRRMVGLYNAALSYHCLHHKHRGRELALDRPSVGGSGTVRLVLLDVNGKGARKHPEFPDESNQATPIEEDALHSAVKAAERQLRH